ncbi:predicted protein [Chaetoceros tenuissimus]|uniref:Uncharacterized protein n=1 Tax=Chaetoceros tenuissimus TaxID=426638 RepID=A0AAD3CQ48_9STRA|nr:predicted protein [Chaetoceros tenuissimus]
MESKQRCAIDALNTEIKKRYEEYDVCNRAAKTKLSAEIVEDFLNQGFTFVLYHKSCFYRCNMEDQDTKFYIRSKIGQAFRDRRTFEAAFISVFLTLDEQMGKPLTSQFENEESEESSSDQAILDIYQKFEKIVKKYKNMKKDTKCPNEVEGFFQQHKHNPRVFETLLQKCTEEHFPLLPQKIRKAACKNVQHSSGEAMSSSSYSIFCDSKSDLSFNSLDLSSIGSVQDTVSESGSRKRKYESCNTNEMLSHVDEDDFDSRPSKSNTNFDFDSIGDLDLSCFDEYCCYDTTLIDWLCNE